MATKKFKVFGSGLADQIGEANTFAECRKIHEKWLSDTNHPNKARYAGLSCEHSHLQEGNALPAFYMG